MSEENSSVLALIPAYNEAKHIANIVIGSGAYLSVLVVDDGSIDQTAEQAQAAGATVVKQTLNQGKGAALQMGLQWALEKGYDAVITLDADGQHDPAELPNFLKKHFTSRADLIIGQRDFSQMPPLRRLANWLGGKSFSWALGQHVPDNQSGYRLLSRRMIEAILNSNEQGFEFEVEMITACVRHHYILAWVPIRTIYAGESSHINPIQHVRNFIRIVWQTRQRVRRGK